MSRLLTCDVAGVIASSKVLVQRTRRCMGGEGEDICLKLDGYGDGDGGERVNNKRTKERTNN